MKLYASLPLSFVALSFSALEHIRKYPASFIKRQEHTQTLNGKDRVFFGSSDIWSDAAIVQRI